MASGVEGVSSLNRGPQQRQQVTNRPQPQQATPRAQEPTSSNNTSENSAVRELTQDITEKTTRRIVQGVTDNIAENITSNLVDTFA